VGSSGEQMEVLVEGVHVKRENTIFTKEDKRKRRGKAINTEKQWLRIIGLKERLGFAFFSCVTAM